MKNKLPKVFSISIFLVILAFGLISCNMPQGTEVPDRFATAAALTVAAELTANPADTRAPTPTEVVETETPSPTTPPTSTETATFTATPSCTNKIDFVTDVTIPDDTNIPAGDTFEKTWRLRNIGTCTWTTDYDLVFDSGNIMGGPTSKPLAGSVPPGSTVDVRVTLTAPAANGTHRGNWKLRDGAGRIFGIGANFTNPFWVQIVVGPTPTAPPKDVYNFAERYCDAQWVSGAGTLPCPGTDSDSQGFVIRLNNPKLENGRTEDEPTLWTHPEWVNNGVISGRFPAFDVKAGDHLLADIGCLYKSGGSLCDVQFQITYRENGGSLQLLDNWFEVYDGNITRINIDLSSLAGSSVEFSLVVTANGSSSQDWAFWLNPHIRR